jgi:Spy/CpxP family protein refolding chaperone
MATAGATATPRWSRHRVLLILLIVSAALNVCFIAGAAWIHLQGPPRGPGVEERYRTMAAELDLDAKQRTEFDVYVAAMRARTAKMQQQVTPLMSAAWEEIAKPQADTAQVMRLFDEAAEKRREFQREATTQTFAFLAVLSPAQRGKFVALERERRGAWLRGRQPQR